MKDKKTKGALAGLIAALLYGGAEVMDHEARITALEEATGLTETEEEVAAEEEQAPALGKPGMAAPPIEPPESGNGAEEPDESSQKD